MFELRPKTLRSRELKHEGAPVSLVGGPLDVAGLVVPRECHAGEPLNVDTFRNPTILKAAALVDTYLQEVYPRYFHGPSYAEIAKMRLLYGWNDPANLTKSVIDLLLARKYPQSACGIFGNRRRGLDLLMTAAVLAERAEPGLTGAPMDYLKERLRGKSILVLGDDVGSFSQILRMEFGADALGVEVDPVKIRIAQKGLLSDKPDPRNYVLHGDCLDLGDRSSSLSSRLAGKSFDMIFSFYLFCRGSGVEHNSQAKKILAEGGVTGDWTKLITSFCEISAWLLKPGGWHLHRLAGFCSGPINQNCLIFRTKEYGFMNAASVALNN
ncbi:MAG: hypothetical protein DCC75_13795 [Proteobacteria bacterium]|nr:MAG: hypothetical protein DCC75_13795 [Pseudomonadota bacterium]